MTCRSPLSLTMPVVVAHYPSVNRSTIRPETGDGDVFFGLEPGTNGTAAHARRRITESAMGFQNALGLTWVRHDGRPARGLQFMPTDRSEKYEVNPWSGRVCR